MYVVRCLVIEMIIIIHMLKYQELSSRQVADKKVWS